MLRGWDNGRVCSRFKELGEIGLAIYFILASSQNAENKIFISINQILINLKLQPKDKKEVIRVLNFLKKEKLICCNKIDEDIEFEILMEADLDFTLFNTDYFEFYFILEAETFALFCVIESYIGTNKSGYPTISKLVQKTGFSKDTILQNIFILNEFGIFYVTFESDEKGKKKNESNEYFRNNVSRFKLLEL